MIYVDSEIGTLEEVIIHTPGHEIEVITPESAKKLLYNDIIPLNTVEKEYSILRNFLSTVAKTIDVKDILENILFDTDKREELIDILCCAFGADSAFLKRKRELLDMESNLLCKVLISGLKRKKDTLVDFLAEDDFDYFPLPNMYFTRDSAMIYKNSFITGRMAYQVREPEAILMRQILKSYYNLEDKDELFAGNNYQTEGEWWKTTIEGGDFIVFSHNILIIGLSQRTTPAAVDMVISEIFTHFKTPITVYCVLLPNKRETIHLDMIFNIISQNEAILYSPYFTGNQLLRVLRIDVLSDGSKKIRDVKNLLEDLAKEGYNIEPIYCGGDDPNFRQREQWLAGNNFFAFAPRKIIGYDCNIATLKALEKGGYAIVPAVDFISNRDKPDNYKKLAVTISGTDLARGGGGVRCMTLPIRRKPFDMRGGNL